MSDLGEGQPLLVTENVTKRFGGFLALDRVSLVVPRGRISALIGPNGAGKSTLFGIIAGSVQPSAGRIVFDGEDVTRVPGWRRARMGMSRAFQVARFFPSFTVAENLRSAVLAERGRSWQFFRSERQGDVEREVEQRLEESGLARLQDVRAEHLAQGDRKRLELVMAMALHPQLLLLDEPTAGMSPSETVATTDLIRSLCAVGDCTVLLTEHDMAVVFDLAEVVTVLNYGQIIACGSPDQISRDPRVVEAYLGEAMVT
ncbi:MAG TPA: ABC transporter ATP-binding protein [Candidatus Dormibacteraeota bacterium]|nr:ABC transporter ATP-binding protein [Candidatus Dormibacteraeota bacterium]